MDSRLVSLVLVASSQICEQTIFVHSAESTGTDLFTAMFAMFAWTKDWKENTSADQILDTTSVVFV